MGLVVCVCRKACAPKTNPLVLLFLRLDGPHPVFRWSPLSLSAKRTDCLYLKLLIREETSARLHGETLSRRPTGRRGRRRDGRTCMYPHRWLASQAVFAWNRERPTSQSYA